jgi:DNA-binding MarR family transcriptional regulator
VKRLVGRGLVTQDQLPGDRRFHGLSLTEAGREVLAAATALVEAQERRMEDALGDIDREAMMEALRRIVGVLRRD